MAVALGPRVLISGALALRAALLLYGHYQDTHSPLKYTDIDYLVFTDASKAIKVHKSPYDRATYRYTPLLAWLLYPSVHGGLWFDFGKVLFALSDILAGCLIWRILKAQGIETRKAWSYASIWLLNPMVAQISTRGSSEGFVVVWVLACLCATLENRFILAGVLLGTSVHLKIYPFIYTPAIVVWVSRHHLSRTRNPFLWLYKLLNMETIILAVSSALSFSLLNLAMYFLYGFPFVEQTFLYHISRSDHRHNFSPYHLLLYLNSSPAAVTSAKQPETLAFVPQLLLSLVLVPSSLATRNLPSTMLIQTFIFVTYNKVCTSQYFLWYLCLLPLHLPYSRLIQKPRYGLTALLLWIVGQGAWLYQGYRLEFIGESSFPAMWAAGVFFYLCNAWMAKSLIEDVATGPKHS